jgi:predicted PurR-regulated permease PerM
MLYLIHNEQRKKIVDNYYVQVWQSLLWALISVFIVIGVLAIPTVVLLQTEIRVTADQIDTLTSNIEQSKSENFEEDVSKITSKIHILKQTHPVDVRLIYLDMQNIIESVPGVNVQRVSVDSLTKTIQLVTKVQDKEVAKNLVDTLTKTVYKGASLSYSVLSEKASFTFAQNLTYE